jgi:hypothetical protein
MSKPTPLAPNSKRSPSMATRSTMTGVELVFVNVTAAQSFGPAPSAWTPQFTRCGSGERLPPAAEAGADPARPAAIVPVPITSAVAMASIGPRMAGRRLDPM